MISVIPEGVFTMEDRRKIVKVNAPQYNKAKKKVKSQILRELSETLQKHPKYIASLLRNTGKTIYTPFGIKLIGDPTVTNIHKRGRKKVYGQELVPLLLRLWELVGYRSSIHLVAFLRLNKEMIFNEIPTFKHLPAEIKDKLLTISSATVERLLKPIKAKLRLKHKYRTNPFASVFKKNIPVEPYFEKPKSQIGYMELDIVHHCGETTKGEFAYTLTATDITTDWTELRALKNKARIWTKEALEDVYNNVPFLVNTFHVDNDSAFINAHVFNFTEDKGIRYTRSREYKKNDAPYVESKNWTMVRSYTGYRRYDTEEELAILKRLDKLISLRHNYFIPTMKLKKKERVGGKVHKEYDINIPLNRVLNSPEVTAERKRGLIEYKASLSYIAIVKEIESQTKKLDAAYRKKYSITADDEENGEYF